MPYCVKCGVELGESERACPLCKTVVYHPELTPDPDAKSPYPHPEEHVKINPKYELLIATLVVLLPTILSLICDYSINHRMVWSGFVVGAVAVLYSAIFLPLLFPKKNAFCYLIPDFAVCLAFEKYLEWYVGGTWFVPFALPVTVSVLFVLFVLFLLRRFAHISDLILSAAIFMFTGVECLLLELLINHTFTHRIHLVWSYYPLVAFVIISAILCVINRSPKLKEKFRKLFFL